MLGGGLVAALRCIVFFGGGRVNGEDIQNLPVAADVGELAIVGELLHKPTPGKLVGVFLLGGNRLDRLKGDKQLGGILMQIDVPLHTRIGQALVHVGLGGGAVGLVDNPHAGVGRLELGQLFTFGGSGVAGGIGKALADGDGVGGEVDFALIHFDNLHIFYKIC